MNIAAPVIEFREAGHSYTVNGVGLPSVTQILKPITGFVSSATALAAGERGTKVHEGCEFVDAGFDADVDPEVRGYCQGYKRFLAETGFTVLRSEYRVANPPARYAGTIDRVGRWGQDTVVLDIKSGVMGFWMPLQLAAYAYGYWVMESGDVKTPLPKCMVLQLFEDGAYKVHEIKGLEEAFAVFLGLARFHRWKEAQ